MLRHFEPLSSAFWLSNKVILVFCYGDFDYKINLCLTWKYKHFEICKLSFSLSLSNPRHCEATVHILSSLPEQKHALTYYSILISATATLNFTQKGQ